MKASIKSTRLSAAALFAFAASCGTQDDRAVSELDLPPSALEVLQSAQIEPGASLSAFTFTATDSLGNSYEATVTYGQKIASWAATMPGRVRVISVADLAEYEYPPGAEDFDPKTAEPVYVDADSFIVSLEPAVGSPDPVGYRLHFNERPYSPDGQLGALGDTSTSWTNLSPGNDFYSTKATGCYWANNFLRVDPGSGNDGDFYWEILNPSGAPFNDFHYGVGPGSYYYAYYAVYSSNAQQQQYLDHDASSDGPINGNMTIDCF